jgi:hypothetical protein
MKRHEAYWNSIRAREKSKRAEKRAAESADTEKRMQQGLDK